MLIPGSRKVVALILAYVMVVMTTPVFAADFSKTKVTLGSVSAVGSIELRGVSLLREGTIFSGDRLRSGEKAYAKVALAGGQKFEIGERSDLTFNRDVNRVRVVITSGVVGFSNPAKESLTMIANPFVIVATHAGSGYVALLSSGSIGVRSIDGTVTVTNTKTGASSQVARGQERFMQTGAAPAASLTELASNVPPPVPLPKLDPPAPQAPAGGSPGPASSPCRFCMDKGAWIALAAAAGVTGTAIVALVVAEHNKTNISNNNSTIATLAAKESAQGNLQALQSSSQQANSSGSQVASTANAVNAAIASAQNVSATTRQSLTAQASALQSQAQASVQQIVSLQSQLQNLQSQLTGTTNASVVASISGQIVTINANLSADITALNALIGQLNSLITAAQNAGVPNVPILTVQPIPLPVIASASSPG